MISQDYKKSGDPTKRAMFFFFRAESKTRDPKPDCFPLGHLMLPMASLKVHETENLHTENVSNSKSGVGGPFTGNIERWDDTELFSSIQLIRKRLANVAEDSNETRLVETIRSQHSKFFIRRRVEDPELLSIGDENSQNGRFNNNAHEFVLRALLQYNEYFPYDVPEPLIGDWWIVDQKYQPIDTTSNRNDPDFGICNQKHIAVCAGEAKTAWTFNITESVSNAQSEYDRGTKGGVWDELFRAKLGK